MIQGAKEYMQAIGHDEDYFNGAIFTADTNYHSESNLKSCQKLELDAYIPDQHFRPRDPRYATQKSHWPKKKKFALEDFQYDEARDHHVCPNGKNLELQSKVAYQADIVRRRYVADEKDCRRCPLKPKCISGRGAKRKCLSVPVAVELTNLSQRMAGKIDTDMGRKIYPHRIALAEPVFANIRTHKRLDRFNLRGKIKVDIQWMLYCMVHNIGKIVNYGST